MNYSFFPKSKAGKVLWCKNYKTKIVFVGPQLGLTQPEIDLEISLCDSVVAAILNVNESKNHYKSAISAKNNVLNNEGAALRMLVARHKTSANYTTSIGAALGAVSTTPVFNPNEYKPTLKVDVVAKEIRIRFVKRGVQGINLYQRTKGDAVWKLVSRVTCSPFLYEPEKEIPNAPLRFEFRAYGVIKDKQVGIASDVYEILF